MSLVSNDSVTKYYYFYTKLIHVGIATPAAVVPVVMLLGVAIIIIIALLYHQYKKALVIIKFSNLDKPGSLAEMLQVFKVINLPCIARYRIKKLLQDSDVNIIRINTYWTEADVKWNLCGKRQMKENYVHVFCTSAAKKELKALTKFNLEFIEDDG